MRDHLQKPSRQQGFTLIELMIVVAIIAILSAIAIPNLLSAKLAANESDAISVLRQLTSAQATFQSTSAVDTDLDGSGEFGTFGEMSGITLLSARGAGPANPLDPPILPSTFRSVDPTGSVVKHGYLFRLFLPDAAGVGVPELAGGGPAPALDTDNCEIQWACYAWPVDNTTGQRAFFVDYRGEILQTSMDFLTYDNATPPLWNAALTPTNGDMGDPLGLNGGAGDGNAWTPVQ